ncbi:MAG TPA: isoleucine--tRNA ligase [Patescibacteria group bacterium]|nr:isoleucine--tRNA ligase [Patescibacteria group bacterium]
MAKNKAYFETPEAMPEFPVMEKNLLKSWYKDGIVAKYLKKNAKSKKVFSFLDGPITANNPMGVHHAWGRTYKDIFQRYKNMQGFKQRFQNGFDAQGLWVEVEVEKELGFKNKKEIEQFGVAKFVQLCRDRVKKYSGIQTDQSKRLGYFMDWDNSYFTLSDDNNYMIWHFLKKCFDSGWIYKGADSVPWCPRCETAISQHEMLTEDYKEVTHESVYLAFPLVGTKDEYFLVWTTTPWTIPANIAIAIDPDLDYVKVEAKGKKYWVAKDAATRVFEGTKTKSHEIVKGTKLVGLRYKGAFDDIHIISEIGAKNDKFHTVVATDDLILPITTDEGTGMVHTAVSAGSEDFRLGKKLGLPMIPVIGDDATYLENLGFLAGKNAKKHPEVIIDYLKKLEAEGKHFFLKTQNVTHRYPACWRCKSELVWKVTDEWYIAMDRQAKIEKAKKEISFEKWENDRGEEGPRLPDVRTLRERMVEVAKKIKWLPSFGLDRELDWLANMHDWLISKKNRYWGLALPIWECKKCGNFEVIGSKEELSERATEGWNKFKGKSPHKPQIDEVKIKCGKCGRVMQRVEPVGNPWLDAGIVPFSTISDDNKAAGASPSKSAPLYLSDKESWNEWFPADFITESFPGQFKNWFYAMIAMSTVLEDVNPFKSVLGFATLTDENGKPMHKSAGNMIEFNEGADKIGVDVMRFMFARQNPAENMLFGYRTADEVRRRFHLKLWNVYNFFVTYANLDGWKPKGRSTKSKNVLDRWIVARLNQTLGLVTESLEKYDVFTASGEIEKFVDDLSLWYVRRSRDRIGPAAESEKDRENFYSTSFHILKDISVILAPITPFISEIIYTNLTHDPSVHLSEWPVYKVVSVADRQLMSQMQVMRQIVEKIHAARKEAKIGVRQPLAKVKVSGDAKVSDKEVIRLGKEETNIKEILFAAGNEKVELDTKITPELEEEARVRDLVRKIQEERKNMGLNLTQKINVTTNDMPTDKKLVQWLMKKAQIEKLGKGGFKIIKSSK